MVFGPDDDLDMGMFDFPDVMDSDFDMDEYFNNLRKKR